VKRYQARRSLPPTEQRFSFDEWLMASANGGFGLSQPVTTWGTQDTEPPPNSFEGYVQSGYKSNGVVFAVISARMRLFSEVRFQWQDMPDGRPGDAAGTEGLDLLATPWLNATTRTLLGHMEQDVSLGGNSYTAKRLISGREELRRLRPDWVDIVISSPSDDPFDLDATVGGYLYYPQGKSKSDPIVVFPEHMAHFAPIPDPVARFRGMSWLSPVIREIQADTSATVHKGKFFDNAATPNLAVTMPITEKAKFLEAVQAMDDNHKGAANAYKTLWLMGGAVQFTGASVGHVLPLEPDLGEQAHPGGDHSEHDAVGLVPGLDVALERVGWRFGVLLAPGGERLRHAEPAVCGLHHPVVEREPKTGRCLRAHPVDAPHASPSPMSSSSQPAAPQQMPATITPAGV